MKFKGLIMYCMGLFTSLVVIYGIYLYNLVGVNYVNKNTQILWSQYDTEIKHLYNLYNNIEHENLNETDKKIYQFIKNYLSYKSKDGEFSENFYKYIDYDFISKRDLQKMSRYYSNQSLYEMAVNLLEILSVKEDYIYIVKEFSMYTSYIDDIKDEKIDSFNKLLSEEILKIKIVNNLASFLNEKNSF